MFKFKKSSNKAITVDLGTKSRKGGGSTKVVIDQVDFEGNPLKGVSIQSPMINAKGKVFKFRGGYHKNIMAYSIANEFTGKYGTEVQPAFSTKSITNYNVADLSEEILKTERNGKIVEFDYKKLDENGKVVSEIKYNEELEVFEKLIYNSPVYKERMDSKGEALKLMRKDGTTPMIGVEEDEKGTYKLTFNEFVHVAPLNFALHIGQKVTESGAFIDNTKGVYLVATEEDSYGSKRVQPQESSVKLGIAQMYDKIVCHPEFGIAKPEHKTKNGLVEGTIAISILGTKIKIFNNDGTAVATIDEAFKLENFVPKRKRGSSIVETEEAVKNSIIDDLAPKAVEEVVEETEEDLF